MNEKFKIKTVNSKEEEKLFLSMVNKIYQYDKDYVRPLDNDINDVFDTNKNRYFEDGKAQRWLLYQDTKIIGRIAAFYSKKLMGKENEGIGGIGFFECIDNQNACHILFQTAENWLKNEGLIGTDAPINFGERDKFWGLFIEGLKLPSYQENYNPNYYQKLLENEGYEKIIEQSTSEIDPLEFNRERFGKLAERVLKNPAYTFETYSADKMDKYSEDFVLIYNQAWEHHENFVPLTKSRVITLMKSLGPVLIKQFIVFAYAHGEPAGIYVNILEINPILKKVNGNMNWYGKLIFLWNRIFMKLNRARGIVFGIIPKYQNLGLEVGMIWRLYNNLEKLKYINKFELAWIGDFNPKMHSMLQSMGAKPSKMHYTYRKVFK